jgi:hypothetical protein
MERELGRNNLRAGGMAADLILLTESFPPELAGHQQALAGLARDDALERLIMGNDDVMAADRAALYLILLAGRWPFEDRSIYEAMEP